MTRLLMAFALTVLLACTTSAPAVAGPNAGGIIIAHDANLLVSSADGGVSLCGQGTVPPDCQAADTELDGAGNLEGDQAVFLVYAAFFPGSSPRLMGVTWGVSYDAGNIVLPNYGKCGDFELNDDGWPAPGKGSTVTWDAPQSAILVPVYWFAAYTNGNSGTFDLGPNPSQGGVFGDDGIPAVLDPIAAYGRLGFDMQGSLPCPDATPGACCATDGSCGLTPQALCALPNVWQGPGTVCTPNPCPQPSGACCDSDGNCTFVPQDQCSGQWLGYPTNCTPNPCPPPMGVCCAADGACTVTTQDGCPPPNVWHPETESCAPNPCPQPSGACCDSDGNCTFVPQDQCSGQWLGYPTNCTPNPCPQPGACCAADGSCTVRLQSQCIGVWMGPNTSCIPDPCPPSGACCAANGTCTITLQPLCNGSWLGPDTSCDPNPCPEPPSGACCYPDGNCVFTTEANCPTGDWHINVACDPNPCVPSATGACCVGASCTITTEAGCSGQWLGPGTNCTPNPCCSHAPPRRPAAPPNGKITPTTNQLRLMGNDTLTGDGATAPRTGGDTIEQATPIPGLPFGDTGATCGYVNDYDVCCPYSGSTSPDVVYSYTPSAAEVVTVDLCASQYDTKIYIFAGDVGNLVACNDDFGCGYSGWQSKVENVSLSAGVTYYIVVDGYGDACGTYIMAIGPLAGPCTVECPAGGVPEGEPPCGANYIDHYNGGCNSDPHAFQPLSAVNGGCIDFCGKSGTYLINGLSYRDTDWFDITGIGASVTATCTAEFPLQFIFIWNADCNNLQYDLLTGNECTPLTFSRYVAPGLHQWIWVGPQVFTGIPCDADYLLQICGISGGSTPVERMSWGRLKNLYKN